ncbi:unnamed protein product [Toxocara canis]|uniref:Uncharacterized protein n=1 Tax=Toxocara canis TaxID=6265 RepID=A0A183UZQ7_TOXCA|nr:unnamed protein product [Toxocara canis]
MISDLLRGTDASPGTSQRSKDIVDATSENSRAESSHAKDASSNDGTASTTTKKQLSTHRFSVTDILSPFDNIGTNNVS